ncbi:hypothetical protein EBB79_13020 [Parasedimentitalea marina]|uniref:Uncharacterized protein n=1 Tax=Parasedimentitalea marina TaxID=2483033 RepID=A0A3T0N3T7_9RHOB|nr:hypothetical protein EBB79_13020 [Parasedimentitalea marina]
MMIARIWMSLLRSVSCVIYWIWSYMLKSRVRLISIEGGIAAMAPAFEYREMADGMFAPGVDYELAPCQGGECADHIRSLPR